jgi:hypothetical protein
VRERRVDAYAQDLSIFGLELRPIGLEVGQLLLSAAGEIQGVKTENDILLAEKILQPDFPLPIDGKRKFRRLFSYLWHRHKKPPEI